MFGKPLPSNGSADAGASFLAILQGNQQPLRRLWSANTRAELKDWKTKKKTEKIGTEIARGALSL